MKYSELSQAIENSNYLDSQILDCIDYSIRLKINRPRTPLKLAQIYNNVEFKLYLMDKYGGNVRTLQRLVTMKLSLESYLKNCVIYISPINHEVYEEF